jgi:hypothetical protein
VSRTLTAVKPAACLLVLVLVLAAVGCASAAASTERVVFSQYAGFSQGGKASTVDVVDFGLPYEMLNLTGSIVRVRAVSLVGVPRTVRLISVTAYGPGPGPGLITGDLLKYCRQSYPPHPITDDTTAPHAGSPWRLVVAVIFTRPGTYLLRRVRLYYQVNGQSGWQYEYLNATMTVLAAGKVDKPVLTGCP